VFCSNLLFFFFNISSFFTLRRDDVQAHDSASKELRGMVHRNTTGVRLIATLRTSVASPTNAHSLATTPLASVVVIKNNKDFMQSDAIKALEQFASAAAQRQFEEALQSQPNTDVFYRVELGELSKTQCVKLIFRILETNGVRVDDWDVLDSIYGVCGGSPLYATELARGLCEQYVRRESSSRVGRLAATSSAIKGMLANFRTERIEEIVYFRFDKQPASTQLVLKMAAVASINGNPFTLEMLNWVLHTSEELLSPSEKVSAQIQLTEKLLGVTDSDKEGYGFHQSAATVTDSDDGFERRSASYDVDIFHALSDLLQTEEFIALAPHIDVTAPAASSVSATFSVPSRDQCSREANNFVSSIASARFASKMSSRNLTDSVCLDLTNSSNNLRCGWKVDVEKRAVYDLLLDEQKESLHDRVVRSCSLDLLFIVRFSLVFICLLSFSIGFLFGAYCHFQRCNYSCQPERTRLPLGEGHQLGRCHDVLLPRGVDSGRAG
jgi:hypothetical protein